MVKVKLVVSSPGASRGARELEGEESGVTFRRFV